MMHQLLVVLGGIVTLVGYIIYTSAYNLAKREEQIDAIGSKRSPEEVEPADWKVLSRRGAGLFVVVCGVLMVVVGLWIAVGNLLG